MDYLAEFIIEGILELGLFDSELMNIGKMISRVHRALFDSDIIMETIGQIIIHKEKHGIVFKCYNDVHFYNWITDIHEVVNLGFMKQISFDIGKNLSESGYGGSEVVSGPHYDMMCIIRRELCWALYPLATNPLVKI